MRSLHIEHLPCARPWRLKDSLEHFLRESGNPYDRTSPVALVRAVIDVCVGYYPPLGFASMESLVFESVHAVDLADALWVAGLATL